MKSTNFTEELDFYSCNVCGNLIIKLADSGLTPVCCGRDMVILKPGTVDASREKHVPVWKIDGCKVFVFVGEDPHPMTKDHYIQCIVLHTTNGYHICTLDPEDTPSACFRICKGEEVIAVYEYCNIHKLWKSETEDRDYDCSLCRD